MFKYFSIFILFFLLIGNTKLSYAQNSQGTPRIINNDIYSSEIIIASRVVTEPPYEADNTGKEDVTDKIQQALWDSYHNEGGSVWLPPGKYRLEGSLTIPEGVTLRGAWNKPDQENSLKYNSIILGYAGKGNINRKALINLKSGSGVKGISIYYPEQNLKEVIPYPPTFRQVDYQNATVENVTLYNSYQGFDFASENNELHYLNNIYMTALNIGVDMDFIYDVGRIVNFKVSPEYWAQADFENTPEYSQIASYTKENTIAIKTGYNDWHFMSNIQIDNCKSGIKFIKPDNRKGSKNIAGGNGSIYNLKIKNTKAGLHFVSINPHGWSITEGSFVIDKGDMGVLVGGDTGDSSIQLNSINFSGKGQAVKVESGFKGKINLMNIIFEESHDSMVEVKDGSFSLQYFDYDNIEDNMGLIELGKNINSAIIKGPGNENLIDNFDPGNEEIVIEYDDQKLPQMTKEKNALDYPAPPKLSRNDRKSLYNVTKAPYNAQPGLLNDNSESIQEALNQAGKDGGGTVYIPAGLYRIEAPLTVPPGVELRGVHDVQFHSQTARTQLIIAGLEENISDPIISLESRDETGSGIRGILLYFAEQSFDDDFPKAYPWTIQAQGKNCWIVNTVLPNSYKGVDLATYNTEGHFIDFLTGAPLAKGLQVGNSKNGWVSNVHFNSHYWLRTDLPNSIDRQQFDEFISWQTNNITGIELLDTGTTLHGTFVFAALDGLVFNSQPNSNKGPESLIVGHGSDAAHRGLRAISLGDKGSTLINYNAVQYNNGYYVLLEEGLEQNSKIKIINSNNFWVEPTVGYKIKGGNLLLQQMHYSGGDYNKKALDIENGRILIENSFFRSYLSTHIENQNAEVISTANTFTDSINFKGNINCFDNVVR